MSDRTSARPASLGRDLRRILSPDAADPNRYHRRDHADAYARRCAEVRRIPERRRSDYALLVLGDIRWWEAERCGLDVGGAPLEDEDLAVPPAEAFAVYRWFFELGDGDRYELVRASRGFAQPQVRLRRRRPRRDKASYLARRQT